MKKNNDVFKALGYDDTEDCSRDFVGCPAAKKTAPVAAAEAEQHARVEHPNHESNVQISDARYEAMTMAGLV